MRINTRDIDYLGLDRVIRRGTGEVIEKSDDALFVYDEVSKSHLLACEGIELGLEILDRHAGRGYSALMISNVELGRIAFKKYGFADGLECYQAAYYDKPQVPSGSLSIRTAEKGDLPMLIQNYHMLEPEDLETLVNMGNIVIGYDGAKIIGFIGEHLEGSIGLLYIFPEFRRMGYAEKLEKHFFARTIEMGFVPFGQVEKSNLPSLELQKKLGLTVSDRLIYWMWK